MPRSARLRRSVGLAVRSLWLRADLSVRGCRPCPCEGVGAAQCVGQPVPAGHAPDQVRRVGCGQPPGGDEQRACRGSAHDRQGVGGGAEPGLGHPRSPRCRTRRAHARPGRAGRRDPGRRSRRPPAGPARSGRPGLRAAVGVRAGRTRLAGRAVPGDYRGAFGQHVREGGIGGQDGCRPGAAGVQVMHVHGGAHAAVRAPGLHVLRMPEPAPGIRERVLAAARTGPQQAVRQVTRGDQPSTRAGREYPPICTGSASRARIG